MLRFLVLLVFGLFDDLLVFVARVIVIFVVFGFVGVVIPERKEKRTGREKSNDSEKKKRTREKRKREKEKKKTLSKAKRTSERMIESC